MSTRELRRAEVLGRVKGQTLRLVDAAKMLELSCRQAKRLWSGSDIAKREPQGCSTAARGEVRPEPSQGNSGGRCCS